MSEIFNNNFFEDMFDKEEDWFNNLILESPKNNCKLISSFIENKDSFTKEEVEKELQEKVIKEFTCLSEEFKLNLVLNNNTISYENAFLLESGNIDSNKDIIFNNQDIDFGYQNDDGENIIMYICKNYIKLFTLHEYLDDPMILYIIEILLKRGVDVNLRNKNGESAIFYAVRDKRSTGDMIRLLIKYGAQVNIWNNSNETPFMIAILNDISKFSAKALFQYVNPNLQDNLGNTSLIYFCQKNINFKDNLQLIKLFLKISGIDLNIQNNEGKTALMYACEINQRTSHEQLNFSTGFTLAADLGILNSEYLLRTKDERENLVPLLGLIKSMVNDFGAKKDLVDIHGRKALDYSKKNESWGNDLITKFLDDYNS